MATNQEVQTLEETLEKTDLGHVINENKTIIMILGAILVVGIIAFSIFDQMQSKSNLEKMDRIFKVESTVFKPFIDGKTTAEDFKAALGKINNELKAEANLIPVFIESINKLDQAGKADKEVLAVTTEWLGKLSKSNHLYTFMALRLAALNEDAKNTDEAIKTLELLVSNKDDLLKDKIHFDLGRLYLQKGDSKTAKERFDFIFKNHKDSQYAKLAKLYMSGI